MNLGRKSSGLPICVAFVALLLIACSRGDGKNSYDEESEPLEETDRIKNTFPDGTYCAEVEYYNANTGTESEYFLTVEVENNEIIQINFPGGGQMDSNHFDNADLDEDGSSSLTSDKGYEYEIQIIGAAAACFSEDIPQAVQCSGTTRSGRRCRRMTDNASGYCWQHRNQE
jgi:major membrane immunogen (membrane-anchored lipoprotein)